MLTRDDILKMYGVPDFEGAEAEGRQIRVCCTTGRLTFLPRDEARRLAAELLLAGAKADHDELAQALDNGENP